MKKANCSSLHRTLYIFTELLQVQKIKEVKGSYAAFCGGDRGQYHKTNAFYLLLSPSNYLYLRSKRSLRNFSEIYKKPIANWQ